MAIRIIFNNLAGGEGVYQPASLIDQQFQDFANWVPLPCSAAGNNNILLTPQTFVPTLPAYGFYNLFSFLAAGTATGPIFIQYGNLPSLPAYLADGVTQAGSGVTVSGQPYMAQYAPSLNLGAGGFYLLSSSITPASAVKPTFFANSAQGLVITNGAPPNTQIAITATSVIMCTQNGQQNIQRTSVVQNISTGATGAGGLDTGALAANKWYHIYLIDNGSFSAGIISLSSVTPNLPMGFIYYMRVGAMFVDASLNLLRTRQAGNRGGFVITASTNTSNLPLMASGPAGAPLTPTWVPVQVQGGSGATGQYVPVTATVIRGGIATAPGTQVMAAPNGNYGALQNLTNPPPVSSFPAGGSNTPLIDFLLESNNIYWAANGGSQLFVSGWTDSVPAV